MEKNGRPSTCETQESRRLIVSFLQTVPDALHEIARRQGKSPEEITADIAAINQPEQQVAFSQ